MLLKLLSPCSDVAVVRKNLLLSAPTGCAAILIEGHTIHALTFLPGKVSATKQGDLEAIWKNVRYLILDEISMVSAELLCQVSERIALAKKESPDGMAKPFGRITVIYAGDLGQLRPVGGAALYAAELLGQLQARTEGMIRGHRGLFGAAIWRQLTHVVELKQNIRA